MKKYININILLAIISCAVIALIMNSLFPLYRFHTFSGAIRYDYTVENTDINNSFTISDLNIYQDQNTSGFSVSVLKIIDASAFEDGSTYSLQLGFGDESSVEISEFVYSSARQTYYFSPSSAEVNLPESVDSVEAEIMSGAEMIAAIDLQLSPSKRLIADNKVMRMENVTLTSEFLRLGFLATSLDVSNYDSIVLEYRYLIDDELDRDDNNSYTVFRRIEGTPDEILANKTYGLYRFTSDEAVIATRPLSVAVILKQGDNRQVIKLDFREVTQSE